VRLTDEQDMLFLYHMRMTEEEYRWYRAILLTLSRLTCCPVRVAHNLVHCKGVNEIPTKHLTPSFTVESVYLFVGGITEKYAFRVL